MALQANMAERASALLRKLGVFRFIVTPKIEKEADTANLPCQCEIANFASNAKRNRAKCQVDAPFSPL
jgi:hypothetical protein